MVSEYLKTDDILARFKMSAMTLHRRMKRTENPFPPPRIGQRGKGCQRLWAIEDVQQWEEQEAKN